MKRLLAFLRLEKAAIRHYHLFYLGFFVVYFALIYGILYHINGLSPFQHNFHFFSNVVGSLSKRFLSDTAPYLFIFYLLFYDAKRLWMRLWLVGIFNVIFLINTVTLAYYFLARANFQFYVLKGFEWHLFFTFLTPVLTVVLIGFVVAILSFSATLIKIRSKQRIWPVKKWLFSTALLALAIGSPFIPIRYSTNNTIRGSDQLEKAFYRTVDLENSGLAVLIREAGFVLYPPKKIVHILTPDEKKLIGSKQLDNQIQKKLPKPYRKIVLIAMESFGQHFLSAYNNQIPGTTPTIDSLLGKYPHIDDFYPSGSFTLHGLAAMLCGHTNLDQTLENPIHDCVPKILAKAGYKTEFIRGATKYYVQENLHFKKFGYDSTFAKEEFAKKYPEFIKTQPKLYKSWGYTDNYILGEIISRLKEAKPDEKLFLTALMLDTHTPGGRCATGPLPSDDSEDPILFSAHCFDRVLGEFMDRLNQENLLTDDTAILLTADHPYPAYFEIPGANFQNSFLLRPNRIPFLIITKDKLSLVAQQGSQVDIAATLLNLDNLPTPPYYMGKSLISNPTVVPMGQDRENGYIIVDGQFHPLSLDPEIQALNKKQKLGFTIQLKTGTTEEFQSLVEAKMKEREQEVNQDAAYFKWYYNKFFDLE